MTHGRRLHATLAATGLVALAALGAGCGHHRATPTATTPTGTANANAPGPDWPMFGLTPTRPNATDRATGVTAADLPRLRKAVVRLPGTVDSSPIVLRNVRVAGATRDVAFGTTIYGITVAVDLDRAKLLWTYTARSTARATGRTRSCASTPRRWT
ncbi:MAG TPA: hypothetical protein VFG42_13000 [Baekduia sp.]|uniref:hypothetical protein n=1 Tax=Baekduia sp. TaxID=2600305 RepID=UPI002D7824D3|nr:hypothetical protein [Baekduia sp.]HET6507701.1 hypothetical protein [Baekduia sp.]